MTLQHKPWLLPCHAPASPFLLPSLSAAWRQNTTIFISEARAKEEACPLTGFATEDPAGYMVLMALQFCLSQMSP